MLPRSIRRQMSLSSLRRRVASYVAHSEKETRLIGTDTRAPGQKSTVALNRANRGLSTVLGASQVAPFVMGS